jgi:hypothetical protein
MKEALKNYHNAAAILEQKLIEELSKLTGDNRVVKLNINRYFNNVFNDELERIKYITTDGNDLFICSGEDDIFFIALPPNDYCSLGDDDIYYVLMTEDDLRADLEEYMLETCDDEDEEKETIEDIANMDIDTILGCLAEFKNYMKLDFK